MSNDGDSEVGKNVVCVLLAADDTKVDILRALTLPRELPHGKDVAIHRAWTAYFVCIVEHIHSYQNSSIQCRSSFDRQNKKLIQFPCHVVE